jgi:phosphate/sulfate permease
VTPLASAIADFALLALASFEDAAIDAAPLLIIVLGALALTIGLLSWPSAADHEDVFRSLNGPNE